MVIEGYKIFNSDWTCRDLKRLKKNNAENTLYLI